MDTFRTIIPVEKHPDKINYETPVLCMGSCFSENIGNKLLYYKYKTDVNPFGILYNPVSVANSIQMLMQSKRFTGDDLHFANGQWFSFSHHSSFSDADKDNCVKKINERIQKSSALLQNARFAFLTFGTARTYRLKSTGEVVSNCHKIPAKEFERQLLKPKGIVKQYIPLLKKWFEINPKLKIVFTVSPIRHWKDGAIDNQISKATLLLAIHELQQHFDKYDVSYFPAYEIMMDELRDYRFYEHDMLHLNKTAVEYIWQRFSETYLHSDYEAVHKNVDSIKKTLKHKPFNPQSAEYNQCLKKTMEKINELTLQFLFIDFNEEVDLIKSIITKK